jgi:ribosome-binding factor A
MNRTERIAEEIKKEISDMIQTQLKDPRVNGIISITKVMLTKDLKYCKIYVSILADNKQEAIEGIKSGAGYMRKELASRIKIRIVPELNFILDDSIEYGAHINEVIKNL